MISPVNSVVLIGFAEALSAPEVVWSLIDAGFEVSAFGRKDRKSALRRSRYASVIEVTSPELDAAATVREVQSLMRSLCTSSPGKVVVLFPLDDSAVWLCSQVVDNLYLESRLRDQESKLNFALAGPAGKPVSLALDKLLQLEAARRAGFAVLPTQIVRTSSEALRTKQSFPLILKASDAVSFVAGRLFKGRHWICGSQSELELAVNSWGESTPLMVQPFVLGTGEGIFGLATSNGVVAWSAHKRLRMMNPHGSGSSACISQEVPDDVLESAQRFILQTGWRGLFMIETLRDARGAVWFMEFNGRPWGSLALSRRQGFEYASWNTQLALDPNWQLSKQPQIKRNLVCRNLGRELMHLLFVLRGPKSKALTEWPGFFKSFVDVTWVKREHSFYNWRKDDLKVFAFDCCYTLRENLFKVRHS